MPQPARIDLDRSVGYLLKQASASLRVAMDAELGVLDLTVTQYSCLELIGQRPGISSAEIARGAFITRQSMHDVLVGLGSRGLLDRAVSAPRGRALPTTLTDAGRALLGRASNRVAHVEQRMLGPLADAQRADLHDALRACVRALDGLVPDPA